MLNSVSVSLQTVLLPAASNVFMTFAGYGRLNKLDLLWAGLCMVGAVCFIFRG